MKKLRDVFKQNKSMLYITIILSIVVFYLGIYLFVSFTNPTRTYSEEIKNETISLEDIEIKMMEQAYNPDSGLYVIHFKVLPQNEEAVVINEDNLKVEGFMEQGEGTPLETKVHFIMNDYFVVEIYDVPEDYKSLKINFKYNTRDTSSNQIELEGSKYTSASKKDINFQLGPKSDEEYKHQSYVYLEDSLNKKVEKNKKAQKNILKSIERLERETSLLDPNDPTLSETEKNRIEETISNNKTDIQGLKKEYETKLKDKESLLENIERVKKVLSEIE